MNVHTPERQLDETQADYKARREASRRRAHQIMQGRDGRVGRSAGLVSGEQLHVASRTSDGHAKVKRAAKKRRNVLRNRQAHRG